MVTSFLFPEASVDRSELLVKCGFIKQDKLGSYHYNAEKKEWEAVEGETFNKKDADEDIRQTTFHMKAPEGFISTGYPRPLKSYRISLEVYDLSLEEPYFWVLEYMRQQFEEIDKLEDSFAAAENSAFFGVTQQRLGAQQDKISQFLATTGKMVKELFQMVRELRILDERLHYYDIAEKQMPKKLEEREKGAEITLKGIFVDLVQGGGKSAASVYGMARELEFITLPDLFFDAPPFKDSAEIEKYVNGLGANFNKNVLRVLIRHLIQFHEWKARTHQEHKNRKQFMLAYLKQHFQIINMYLAWIRPYLRHVEKLNLKEKNMNAPEIISAFEGSMLDIELLCKHKRNVGGKEMFECLLLSFQYRTRPELKVVQEGYQRGPVHIGRFEMISRAYHWGKEEVDAYKLFKQKESLLLMGNISSTVAEAMKSLGTELDHYLAEAQGELEKKEEKKSASVQEKTWKEKIFGLSAPKAHKKSGGPEKKYDEEKIKEFRRKCQGHAVFHAWNSYHTFKKANRMIAW